VSEASDVPDKDLIRAEAVPAVTGDNQFPAVAAGGITVSQP
jgi:hypothetical protein